MGPVAAETRFAPAARSHPEAIRRCSDTLRTSGLVASSFDAMPDPVFVLDHHRQIVFANEAALHLLRRPANEVLGARPGEALDCEISRSAPAGCGTANECRTCGSVLATLQALEGRAAREECRISRRCPNECTSENLDLRVHCRPLRVGNDDLVVLVASDISAEKRREVLERTFFHDILNLAGSVAGIADLLVDDLVPLASVSEDLQVASREIVLEIQNQQLLLAAEQGALHVEARPLVSLPLLQKVRQAFRRHPVAVGRSIDLDPYSPSIGFLSDETLLTRVLGNLVKNALEAVPDGGRVTLGCRHADAGLAFWCHNDGAMPEPARWQVFRRSFSTKGKGRGIGTYSVKLLAEKYLGGSVSFVSTPPAGTTFVVQLPGAPSGEPTAAPRTDTVRRTRTRTTHPATTGTARRTSARAARPDGIPPRN